MSGEVEYRDVTGADPWQVEHLGSRRFRFTNRGDEEARAVLLTSVDHPASNLRQAKGKVVVGDSFEVKIASPTLLVQIQWMTPTVSQMEFTVSLR